MAHLVFVYGSLLSGLGNHHVIEAGTLLGEAITEAAHTMVSLGGFPGVIDGGDVAIAGELYAVSDTTMGSLDRLESNGSFYTRTERRITLTDGRTRTAWIYLLPESYLDHHVIESGSWRQHRIENPPLPPRAWWTQSAHAADDFERCDFDDEPELEPELEAVLELMCEGCDNRIARTKVLGMELCHDCAHIFQADDEDGEVA